MRFWKSDKYRPEKHRALQTRRRLSISLTRDEYGGYAIEIKTRKTF
jgi:hypothetical protein